MAAALPTILASVAGAFVTNLLKEEAPQAQQAPDAVPAAPPPTVEPVPEMPTPDDAQAKAAKRRSIAAQMARRGRASTILTDTTTEKLGG